MSKKTSKQILKEALLKDDDQLVSNWASFRAIIMNFEQIEWKEASKIARQLINHGNVPDYLSQVRKEVFKVEKSTKPKKASSKPKAEKEANAKKGIELFNQSGRKLREFKVKVIEPSRELPFTLDFSRSSVMDSFTHGLQRAEQILTVPDWE